MARNSVSGGTLTNEVIVKDKDALTGTLDSSKLYLIDGVIDMGADTIKVPEGGITIQGLGYNISTIFSSEDNHKVFIVDPAGSYSGDVIIRDVTLYVDGTNSQIFDLNNAENNGTVELASVNVGSFALETTSGGEIASYRQYRSFDFAFIRVVDGFTFSGTMAGGMAVRDSILLSIPAGATIFNEGTSLSIEGSVVSNINALSVASDVVVWDFDTSVFVNDDGFLLTGARFSSDDPLPNIDSTSTKVKISDCTGVRDTYVGGAYTVTTEATTTIPGAGTLVKMAGTTMYSDLQWFSTNGNNSLVYGSEIPIEVSVSASLSFDGFNNRQVAVQVRKWDDSASSYVNIGPEYQGTLNGGILATRAENISALANTMMEEGDRIEVWIANITDATDITAVEGGVVFVRER